MTAYETCNEVEARGRRRLAKFFHGWSQGAPLLELTSREDQKLRGDYVVTPKNGTPLDVELKTVAGSYEHFFIETWSNKARGTQGWLYTSRAHRLVYHYQEDDRLFVIDLLALRQWIDSIDFDLFREVQQEKYDQLNDTWGILVQQRFVRDAIGFKWEGVAPPLPEAEGYADNHLCYCGQYGTRSMWPGLLSWRCVEHC